MEIEIKVVLNLWTVNGLVIEFCGLWNDKYTVAASYGSLFKDDQIPQYIIYI